MSASAIPVDLVLFGMIAVFLVLRLRSILGRRQGFEGTPEAPARRPAAPVIDGHAEPPASPDRPLPDPASETGHALLAMQAMDLAFSPAAFLAGAEHAFRLIVTAFAAGDREKLARAADLQRVLDGLDEDIEPKKKKQDKKNDADWWKRGEPPPF